jgi:hypothetical protein
MIVRCRIEDVVPGWVGLSADRYMTLTTTMTCYIQTMDDPSGVYVVTDEPMPNSMVEAHRMIAGHIPR